MLLILTVNLETVLINLTWIDRQGGGEFTVLQRSGVISFFNDGGGGGDLNGRDQ